MESIEKCCSNKSFSKKLHMRERWLITSMQNGGDLMTTFEIISLLIQIAIIAQLRII